MFAVSAEIYEILALAARYVFAFLGVLIVLRTYRWLLSDRMKQHARLRSLPDAGMIGELVVLEGSDELPANAYLPVPAEGILGSVRSCDLTVPCPGVRKHHLDFVWEDRSGLLLYPRRNCQIQADDRVLEGTARHACAVLRHGSFLRVGSALLRLRVYAGVDPSAGFDAPEAFTAEAVSGPDPEVILPDSAPVQYVPDDPAVLPPPDGFRPPVIQAPPESAVPTVHPPADSRRSSGQWKEDWSE